MSDRELLGRDPAANPLQRFFGIYLRMRRNSAELSTGQVAQRLGKTETYYRLIEAGRAHFSAGSAQYLIDLFSEYKVRIHFSSLAIFLLGIEVVGKSMKDGASSNALSALENVPEFKEFLETIVFCASSDRREVTQVVYKAMCIFLETSPSERELRRPCLFLDNISPRGIQALKTLHRNLEGRRFIDEKV